MSVIRRMGLVAGLVVGSAAWGQAYPVKPVRVVIVFPPGGATDIVGRIAFQKVGEQLNQQFVIDNRVGAGGTIGAAYVAKSPPDGYTLMVYSTTLLANAHLYRKLPYDALRDFTGITPVARLVNLLTVHPSMPMRSVKDLIALARARPNEITYGSAGVGALQHLSTSLFCNMAHVKMVHVPYKGGGPAAVATASGEVQMLLTPISEVLPHVQAHRLRPIAVSSEERVSQMPNIPTIGETVKGYEFSSWMGTFAPAGTPHAILEKLNGELRKAVADRAVADNLSSQSLDPMYLTLDAFAKRMRADYDKYGQIVKTSGIRLD
jgi:tripartite-type tricarboxylate transporter receptor subunit TctC